MPHNLQPTKGRRQKPKPPVKWAGGKTQLLSQFAPLFPRQKYNLYLEPFVGGGAVFFHLQPSAAILIDSNAELINFYRVVRDNLEQLLEDLAKHKNTREYYYSLRALDPEKLSPVQRASRFLYLNKTAYNGLWRVNSKGRFNVPFGRYKNPRIIDEENLQLVAGALRRAELLAGDFSLVLKLAPPGAFVYFDPPYDPLSETANFTSYTPGSFTREDQLRLSRVFAELDRRGCLVMLSNSDTPFIRSLYSSYNIRVVTARRAINCRPDGRGPVTELVIRNY
ncbi:MAG TPA: DNA adenine methylase [Firmicutes bacterium]|nr:DNA adenine methylase [Bacillota bacterium]